MLNARNLNVQSHWWFSSKLLLPSGFVQPDFVAIKSLLETTFKAWGFTVVFLLKFHCELNFIEQCWGYVKQIYQMYLPSSNCLPKKLIWNKMFWVHLSQFHLNACTSEWELMNLPLIFFSFVEQVLCAICLLYGCLWKGLEWETGCLGCKKIPWSSCSSRKQRISIVLIYYNLTLNSIV